MNIETLIKSGKATIVDVRTPAEFAEGHVEGSINLPLHEFPDKIEEIKSMENIVLCCASGNRSSRASAYLKQNGIESQDGGSWLELNRYN